MLNRQTDICTRYIEAVFRHGVEPMEPKNFVPDWKDQPSRYKVYRQVERFPLPDCVPRKLASMAHILDRISSPLAVSAGMNLADLSTLLLFAHGLLNRRFDVNWNRDERERTRYAQTIFGRGTASGGGRYPTELFWVCGQGGSLRAGVYHYDPAHHALARLLVGDFTRRIRVAVRNHPTALATDQFLVVSLNFWKNAFKYHSYAYHVVTQDVGALLGSLRLLGTGLGIDLPFLFWYCDEELNRLLGLETASESAFVVIPLPACGEHDESSGQRELLPGKSEPYVTRPAFQRSKRVTRFPTVEAVHFSSLISEEPLPDAKVVREASCDWFSQPGESGEFRGAIALPEPVQALLEDDLLDIFRRRQSGFGRFSSCCPLQLAHFATMLAFVSACRSYRSDQDETPAFTRLMIFVNNIEGLQRGAYAYDSTRHCLWEVSRQDFSLFLQQHYFLRNYNLGEVAALLVIVGKPHRMLAAYGNRGYRILNAEVGLVAQSAYLASSALGFNCGAALGFDNLALNTALGLDGMDERSMLFLPIGYGLKNNASFNAQFV